MVIQCILHRSAKHKPTSQASMEKFKSPSTPPSPATQISRQQIRDHSSLIKIFDINFQLMLFHFPSSFYLARLFLKAPDRRIRKIFWTDDSCSPQCQSTLYVTQQRGKTRHQQVWNCLRWRKAWKKERNRSVVHRKRVSMRSQVRLKTTEQRKKKLFSIRAYTNPVAKNQSTSLNEQGRWKNNENYKKGEPKKKRRLLQRSISEVYYL